MSPFRDDASSQLFSSESAAHCRSSPHTGTFCTHVLPGHTSGCDSAHQLSLCPHHSSTVRQGSPPLSDPLLTYKHLTYCCSHMASNASTMGLPQLTSSQKAFSFISPKLYPLKVLMLSAPGTVLHSAGTYQGGLRGRTSVHSRGCL